MISKLLVRYKRLSIPAKASVWFLCCTFVQKGISVITTPIFTRLLSTDEYGEISVYTSWLNIIIIIVTLNLAEGVFVPGLVKYSEKKNQFISVIHGLTISLIVFWLGIYLIFHDFWNRRLGLTTPQMLTLFLQMWVTSIFMYWAREQRVDYKYKILVGVTIAHAIFRPLCGIIALHVFSDKVMARIYEMALVDLVFYFPLFVAQMRRGKTFFSKDLWVYAVSFNLPLIMHFLSQTVLNSSDRIMIKNMISEESAGIYTLAYQIALLVNLFSHAMKQAMSPWTFQMLKNNKPGRIHRIGYIALLIMATVSLVFICFAPELVRVFAPPSYHDAIWVIPPVTISVYFQLMYLLFVDIELYFEKTKTIAVSTFCGALLNLILNFFFIRLYGYYAAGYTTLFCFILIAIIHYFFMRNINKRNLEGVIIYDGKILLLLSLIVLCLVLIVTLSYSHTLLRYAITFCIAVVTIVFRNNLVQFIKETKNTSNIN